jgi:hypothetical protein
MQGIRTLGLNQTNPPPVVSIKALGALVGLTPTFSVLEMIKRLKMPVSFHATIVTPSGTALGGAVDLTLFSDGRYSFNVHMHDSGADPYTFRVRCAVTTPGGCFRRAATPMARAPIRSAPSTAISTITKTTTTS